MTIAFHYITGIPLSNMIGILSGAVTNTPSLGAAQQALLQINPNDIKGVSDMALACAVAYPLGVVGVILAIIALRAIFVKKKLSFEKTDKSTYAPFVAEYYVCNPAIFGKTIKEIMKLTEKKFVITRVWRDGKVKIATSDTQLSEGDHVLLISKKEDTDSAVLLFGKQENKDWNNENIDWNAIDSQLISRRIIVTRNKINGVKLGSLNLRNNYNINITRINRAGFDLLASPDLHLQIGDRLTVVGEAKEIEVIEKLLGGEAKRLDNPNLIVIFTGILFGVILGALPIPFPGLTLPIKLGIAGGPIIVGILMGAFGPRIHITTYTTTSANLMMRQLGIVIYLAGLGIISGEHFFETVFKTEGLLWIGLGFLLTVIPVMTVGYISSSIFKLNYEKNVGMLCGSMANPMALNYANSIIDSDEPSVAYATVYPLCMFLRVICAQIILLFFA